MAHRILGVGALLFWLWVLLHLGQWFPLLLDADTSVLARAARGAGLVLAMPLLGAAMLIVPDWFAGRWSPHSSTSGEPYLDRSFWVMAGYLVLLLAWALLQLFR